jgi:hypothetical protein
MINKVKLKKNENETEKVLGMMAAKENDKRIERSQQEY